MMEMILGNGQIIMDLMEMDVFGLIMLSMQQMENMMILFFLQLI